MLSTLWIWTLFVLALGLSVLGVLALLRLQAGRNTLLVLAAIALALNAAVDLGVGVHAGATPLVDIESLKTVSPLLLFAHWLSNSSFPLCFFAALTQHLRAAHKATAGDDS